MRLEEDEGDAYRNQKNSKILLYVLIANAIIVTIMQTSIFFELFRFLEDMLRMMPGESPLRLKLEEYMKITSILQYPIALICISFPILTYLKLRRTYKTGGWGDIRAWFRLIGISSLISAFVIFFFFIILMPLFGAFILLSFPFLATGIILLRSLKHVK
ncbi:MAG: hypothetical protein QXI42_00455 [Thermoproteota archaeon]|nr:hypothetical protein [Candidatus Brockarchaeota archaeon]